MLKTNIYLLCILLPFIITQNSHSQEIKKESFQLVSRYSFYTLEKKGEFLLHVPESLKDKKISVEITAGKDSLTHWDGIPDEKIVRIPFDLNLKPATYQVNADITLKGGPDKKVREACRLYVLTYKPNEVKTDRLTGGLIVNKRPFFPFGFYCYSPVESSVLEDEIIRGFNMISPYQKIMPETFADRKSYMDRCAQLGMKVHYNLLSVSGGGGVGSKIHGLDTEEKKKRLLEEIAAFRDHPALLGWYIADEPNGYKIPPAELERIYETVREADPWHPVSIVFMAPFTASRKYAEALDIVMADPYPLPDLPASLVGEVAGQLKKEFEGKRPVWMVPQAFGGGENWKREPTVNELRSMTWQSIINGATGIQYFVRQAPNYFPKSTVAWNECGQMAMETAELTPWLLSDEKAPEAESSTKVICVTSRLHNGKLLILAVNSINRPLDALISIKGINDARAVSVFEDRPVAVNGGMLSDNIAAFGFQAYMIDLNSDGKKADEKTSNLIIDPGFEDTASPGIPSACYVRPGGDNGATYFLDSREHYEGDHSLRLVTPVKDKSVAVRFFPVRLRPGGSYMISLWAKSDPEQRFKIISEEERKLPAQVAEPQYVEVSLGEYSRSWFVPGPEWRQYMTFIKVPEKGQPAKVNLILKMPGQGVAWFDQIKIMEESRGE
ncbi:MAG TPA: hypothetical protein VHO68_09750 [Bacteroidales bacterium]|nr:hypothetical protein [Bacteroidales bacterium]